VGVATGASGCRALTVAEYRVRVRLEPLCTFDWSYDEGVRVSAPGYALITPYMSDEGIAYGEGRGTTSGRIVGTVVWSNYPHRRSDGRMLPDVRGLITTEDGVSIVFELRGRTVFTEDDPSGRQHLVGWFETDHERYRWLNDAVCIAEGRIHDDGMRIRVYTGVHELGS
jgi:hypothetical protein